jgi:hypothetical protein
LADGTRWNLHFAADGKTRTYDEGDVSGWKIRDEYTSPTEQTYLPQDGQTNFERGDEYAQKVKFEYEKSPDGLSPKSQSVLAAVSLIL